MSCKSYEEELQLLIDKVEQVNNLDWVSVAEELGLEMSPETLRKSFTGGRYGGYRVAKFYQDKIENGILSSEEIENIKSAKDILYKERVRLQDARREYNKLLRHEARYENLVEVLKKAVENVEPFEYIKHEYKYATNIHAALLLSDIHYGLKIDNVLNEYNIDICKERMKLLLDKVIYFCQLNRVEVLHVNFLGDIISGLIHLSARVANEEDVITQTIEVGEMLAGFIHELNQWIPQVKVYGCTGNHSRVTADKKTNVPAENFERLIFEYIRLRVPSVRMSLNGLEDWVSYKIKDKLVFATHGDKDTVQNVKMHSVNLLKQVPDVIYLGHIHHMNLRDDNGTEIITNGSICSVDEYAMGNRLNAEPYQILQIYGNDTLTYRLNLRNQAGILGYL